MHHISSRTCSYFRACRGQLYWFQLFCRKLGATGVISLDMSEKCQLLPVRIPSLFEQNVLKAVGRTQIEGRCKVYAGRTNRKTNWKLYPWSLACKKWGALEAPWQMTPIRAAFICSKACDIIGEDAFSVASLHSSILFLRPAGAAWSEIEGRYLQICELRLEDLKTVTFYFWTLQEDYTPDKVTFTYLLEPFSSLLHVWLCRHQLSYCHACRGQTRQFQLVPVRSPRLLDRVFVLIHPLNWKSPHHARKGKEPGRMPYWKDKGHVSTLIFQGKVWIVTAGTIGDVANIAF